MTASWSTGATPYARSLAIGSRYTVQDRVDSSTSESSPYATGGRVAGQPRLVGQAIRGSLAVWGPGLWPPRASSGVSKRVSTWRSHIAREISKNCHTTVQGAPIGRLRCSNRAAMSRSGRVRQPVAAHRRAVDGDGPTGAETVSVAACAHPDVCSARGLAVEGGCGHESLTSGPPVSSDRCPSTSSNGSTGNSRCARFRRTDSNASCGDEVWRSSIGHGPAPLT